MSTIYINGTERGIWASIDPITPVKAYKVGGSIYATPRAAANKMAWGLILNKYSNIVSDESIQHVRKVGRYECKCLSDHDRDEYGRVFGYKYAFCPLHRRKAGYFARLHARLVSIILARYDAQARKAENDR